MNSKNHPTWHALPNSIRCLPIAAFALAGVAAHAQDANAGKAVFDQCSVCHTADDTSAVAPTLKGIVGRKSGEAAGFRYSRAMKNAGKTWDAATLDAYIANPQAVVPGNLMPFSGIEDGKQRADLVAYLATLK